MAMLASSVLPMLMKPEVRKGIGKVAKYLLIFGGLGVAVLAFIMIAKKFDPFRAVSSFFGKATKGVTDLFKGVLGGVGGVVSGVLSDFGKIVVKKQVPKKMTYQEKTRAVSAGVGAGESTNREFRRYSKLVVRALQLLKTKRGIPKEMVERISMVQSAFRKVDKTFVRDIPKQFEIVFNRKRDVLEGNLVKSMEKKVMEKMAREYARKGKAYAAKLTMMKRAGDF